MNAQVIQTEALADLYSNLCNLLGKANMAVSDNGLGVITLKNKATRCVQIFNAETADLNSTDPIHRLGSKLYFVGIMLDEVSKK